MKDEQILNFLSKQDTTAQYITSVCTGSLILAAANLLQGYEATCHWAFQEQLKMLGVTVVDKRIAIDRNRITGAGVTSGIDFGLVLLSLLYDDDMAKMAQLMMEYQPQPPFDAGKPETAGEQTVALLLKLGKPLVESFWQETRAIATSTVPLCLRYPFGTTRERTCPHLTPATGCLASQNKSKGS